MAVVVEKSEAFTIERPTRQRPITVQVVGFSRNDACAARGRVWLCLDDDPECSEAADDNEYVGIHLSPKQACKVAKSLLRAAELARTKSV